jgi:hypothetical protein
MMRVPYFRFAETDIAVNSKRDRNILFFAVGLTGTSVIHIYRKIRKFYHFQDGKDETFMDCLE